MRIIARCFGLSMITLFGIILFSQLMSFDVRQDELNSCISTAMTSTQIVMQEQIEDQAFGTEARRKSINSNEQYVEEFSLNFYKLVTTDTKYRIRVYGVDYKKGLLDIGVEGSFKMLNGNMKVIKARKTSIVDIIQEGD